MAIARLIKGGAVFDLTTNGYSLGGDFLPPASAIMPDIAGGNGMGYRGGSLVGETPQDRQWSFGVRILGTTEADVMGKVRHLSRFLGQYNDPAEPMYFEASSLDIPEPLHGQLGAPGRYQVIQALPPTLGNEFTDIRLRASGINVTVTLTIRPYRMGKRQRVAASTGAVWPETVGAADGRAKGLRIAPAATNLISNPNFSATNTNWNEAANIVEQIEYNPHWTFAGSSSSMVLQSRSTLLNTYTQDWNAGNTNKYSFSAIVARYDNQPVTAADTGIYYNSIAQTTTYESIGNGLYLMYADNISGVNAVKATGIWVAFRGCIRLLAYQVEQATYHTPMIAPNMMGVSSAGVRTAGFWRLPVGVNTFNLSAGAIHIVWQTDYANTQAGNRYFFYCAADSLRAYFNATDDKIYFQDLSNTISTAAQTFAAGDVIDMLFTWGSAGLKIYLGGSSTPAATTANYDLPTLPSYLYVGSDSTPANHASGIFQCADIYDIQVTGAQYASIYAAITPLLTAKAQIDNMPCLWSTAGDNVLQNHTDSAHRCYAIGMDIPGDSDAETSWVITPSDTTPKVFWLARTKIPQFESINPAVQWYFDQDGTATGATDSGGAITETTVNTSDGIWFCDPSKAKYIEGPQTHYFARLSSATANLTVSLGFHDPCALPGVNPVPLIDPYKALTTDATRRWYYLGNLGYVSPDFLQGENIQQYSRSIHFKRTTGSGALDVDFFMILNGPALKITYNSFQANLFINGTQAFSTYTAGTIASIGSTQGEPVDLCPASLNYIWFITAADGGAHVIADTGTLAETWIAPRWGVL